MTPLSPNRPFKRLAKKLAKKSQKKPKKKAKLTDAPAGNRTRFHLS
jgi:hypothetical protein